MTYSCPYCAATIDVRAEQCPHCGSALEAPLGAGERVGERFQVVELLGVGPLGATYRVRDLTSGVDLALKVVADSLCPSDADRAGFVGRAEIFAGRTIAGCAMPLEVACDARAAYVTAPLVEGVTLRAVLGARSASRKPLAQEEALRVLVALSASVSALHSATAHGALRPENVMVTARGLILTDAAIAGAIPPDKLQPRMQSFARAAPFISPEAARGKKITATSDLYALGAISAELLAGSPQVSVLEHAKLPPEVDGALRALLDPNPSRRPGAVPTLLLALARACGFDRRPPDPPLPVPEVPVVRPTVTRPPSARPPAPRPRIPTNPPPGAPALSPGSSPRASSLGGGGTAPSAAATGTGSGPRGGETAVTIAGRPSGSGGVAQDSAAFMGASTVPPGQAVVPPAPPRARGVPLDLPRAPTTDPEVSGAPRRDERPSEPPTSPRPFAPPRADKPATPAVPSMSAAQPGPARAGPALPSLPSMAGARGGGAGAPRNAAVPAASRPVAPGGAPRGGPALPAMVPGAAPASAPGGGPRVPLPSMVGGALPARGPGSAPANAPRPGFPGPVIPSAAPIGGGPKVKIPSLPGAPTAPSRAQPGGAPQGPARVGAGVSAGSLPPARPAGARERAAEDEGIDPRLLRAAKKIEAERRKSSDVEDLDSGEVELLDERE